jgi:hypothetical protein
MELFSAPEPDIVADNDDQTPVFIVGMPRSGTTLVEQILASHGDVHGGGELPHLFNAMDTMPLNNPDKIEFPQNLALADAFALNSAAQYYLDRLHQLAPCAARITDKLPGNILHVGIIARILPAARIIHIRRNAMDTCLSCFAQNFGERLSFTTDLDHLAAYYAGYDRISRHWGKVLPSRWLELSYEDLVADTEGESRRLLDFIDLPWDPVVLNFHDSGRIVSTASYDQVRQPIYRGSIDRWRNYSENLQPLLAALQARGIGVETVE